MAKSSANKITSCIKKTARFGFWHPANKIPAQTGKVKIEEPFSKNLQVMFTDGTKLIGEILIPAGLDHPSRKEEMREDFHIIHMPFYFHNWCTCIQKRLQHRGWKHLPKNTFDCSIAIIVKEHYWPDKTTPINSLEQYHSRWAVAKWHEVEGIRKG